MSLAKILWIVSFAAAVIFSFVSFDYAAVILVLLGLVSGWFVDAEHRSGLILAAAFLLLGGASAWGAIPEVGKYFNGIFGSYGAVLGAASLTAILKTTWTRLKP